MHVQYTYFIFGPRIKRNSPILADVFHSAGPLSRGFFFFQSYFSGHTSPVTRCSV